MYRGVSQKCSDQCRVRGGGEKEGGLPGRQGRWAGGQVAAVVAAVEAAASAGRLPYL